MTPPFTIRRATPEDGVQTSQLLEVVVAERVHSAIDRAWSGPEQRDYIASLSPRDALHIAVDATGRVVGSQSIERYSPVLNSMGHVAQLGTFVLPEWRGRGVGQALFEVSRQFARSAGYRKIVINVRASNEDAQAFYRRLGFVECGRLTRQVVIDGVEDDEILLEYFGV